MTNFFIGGEINIPGMPFICGDQVSDFCFKYDALFDSWELSGLMGEARGYSGYASADSWGLVMAGGYRVVNLFDEYCSLTSNRHNTDFIPGF